ncbi:GNAT family N-acetyltransferase, partial [uncultured Amnibacterium sp.]|uniref:GNAT family N-acetyltransferase n=1 Tax=uncultured Amnibacterium sp. TaxID=1631851 RepID=UPI0035CC6672
MTFLIRAPTADDAEAVGRMHLAAWREAYAHLLPQDFFDDDAEARWMQRWTANLAEPRADTVSRIALRGDEVVGLATAGPGRANESGGPPVRDRELWALYVRSSEYGSGLGHQLLTAVLPEDVPAELWVFEANPRARAFYAKHGFEATEYTLRTDQLGTQLDPPAHWAPEYPGIDELPA